MRVLATSALFVLCLNVLSHAEPPHGVSTPLWEAATGALFLSTSDLGFHTDYVAVDGARLAAVDRAMTKPHQVPGWLIRQPSHVFDFSPSPRLAESGDVPFWLIAAPTFR